MKKKGLSKKTANLVARELTLKDAYAAHIDIELGIDPDNLTNAQHAAVASALSFFVGAIIPLIAIILPPPSIRIPIAFVAVLLALVITGYISAKIGKAKPLRAIIRVVAGGAFAMIVTYLIGSLFHVPGI